VIGVAFAWFLRTDFGMAMRAAGDNPALIALALRVGLDPIDLKLATAAFVLATLALPGLGVGKRLGWFTR
jgi:ABC-type uncharacterized transport system permease subunit